MRTGVLFQTVPQRVEVIEHTGHESLSRMSEWVIELRMRGLVGAGTAFSMLMDCGEAVGRLHVGPGADALIMEGGYLVFRAGRGAVGWLEVVDAERFHREFQPLR